MTPIPTVHIIREEIHGRAPNCRDGFKTAHREPLDLSHCIVRSLATGEVL